MTLGLRILRALLIVSSTLIMGDAIGAAAVGGQGGSCEGLASLTLATGAVTRAEAVTAGAFQAPGGSAGGAGARLPAFCRVAATLTPSSDSDIKIEVWLPAAGWNGKFQAVGNGAFSGAIAYPAMMTALARGYAVSSTDTGHAGGSASFGLGHPEKIADFGWRAVHEMTAAAKQIIARYYEAPPSFSYWNGCSAGGRQAMKEAQRFPEDFDGIIAGAPGLDWTGRAAQALRIAQRLARDPAARIPVAKAQLLHRAVLDACDALDGASDGIIEDPSRCTFDPARLQCAAGDDASCLTAAQVETARAIYASPANPQTKRPIPGLLPGSELGWTDMGWTASARDTGLEQFRFLVFKDPHWTIDRFAFDTDIVRAEQEDAGVIDALDPNFAPFLRRGGKLLQYHGWADPQISPASSVQYYRSAADAIGGTMDVSSGYRLFMVPGMAHCRGGEGPDTFDMVGALERWVEQRQAPARILASRTRNGRVERTRPLCPYPQTAAYAGSGSLDEAANFYCR